MEATMPTVESDINVMKSYRYLALGDSYTIGEGVPSNETWPSQLSSLVHAESPAEIELKVMAKTGWTAGELLEAMNDDIRVNSYSFGSVLIGVNDQYRGESVAAYREALERIFALALPLTGHHLFCLSIPDWSVTPFGRKENRLNTPAEIDAFNKVANEMCDELDILFVDVTSISRKLCDQAGMIAEDGLHYSGLMYRLWAESALPYVRHFL